MDTTSLPRPVGLVLMRPTRRLGSEPFYQEFIAGAESVLGPTGHALVLQVVAHEREEIDAYRRWARDGDIAAVVLVDLALDDPRVELLAELGIPAIIVGDPRTAGPFASVWTDDTRAMRDAVAELHRQGHERIGRVTGPARHAHTRIRSDAFWTECARLGVQAIEVAGDYSEDGGAAATVRLLDGPDSPTAIVYDDDVMAIGGLDAARDAGRSVPEDLSILAWDDSALCQLSSPALAAMGHDVRGIGEAAGESVLQLLTTGTVENRQAATAVFVSRGSVGIAPRGGVPTP